MKKIRSSGIIKDLMMLVVITKRQIIVLFFLN